MIRNEYPRGGGAFDPRADRAVGCASIGRGTGSNIRRYPVRRAVRASWPGQERSSTSIRPGHAVRRVRRTGESRTGCCSTPTRGTTPEAGVPTVLDGAGPRTLEEANGHRADENLKLHPPRSGNRGRRRHLRRPARTKALSSRPKTHLTTRRSPRRTSCSALLSDLTRHWALSALAVAPSLVLAQTWLMKLVRIVVTLSPGCSRSTHGRAR